MTPGARVLPTRSEPNRRLAAERGRTGVVGNTGSSGRPYSAETAETAETALSERVFLDSGALFLDGTGREFGMTPWDSRAGKLALVCL